jgi:dipeptidyl aminopeptidase/acylaminoacyl peptidase
MISGIALFVLLCGWSALSVTAASAAEKSGKRRALAVDDYFELGEVADPRISPDGRWIAHTVTTQDLEEDEARTRIWMVPADGGDAVPLSAEGQSSSSPRWSPDGRYLGFLSARDEDEDEDECEDEEDKTQVWTLFRKGGEAVQRTDTVQGVEAFEWSPDSKRMVLVLKDPKPEELEAKRAKERGEACEEKTPPPWVVTRRQFKRDYVGYLDSRRDHLYVLDLTSEEIRQITSGDFDDAEPAWSPDGSRIAFTSNRTEDPDANYNTDIWVVKADNEDQGARLVQITTNPGPDATPSWSPDGARIAHTSNTETKAASLYATNHLAVSAAAGGDSKLLTRDIDRMVFAPRFSKRDDSIYFLLEDSGEQNLARVSASGGPIERLIAGPRAVQGFDQDASGEIALTLSEPHLPTEVFLFADAKLERRSHVNDALLASLRLGEVEMAPRSRPS